MNTIPLCKPSLTSKLIVVSLMAGLTVGIGAANAVGTSSQPQAHSKDLSTELSDTAITDKVMARLTGEENLGKSIIDVTTTNGVVTLDGAASSSMAASVAKADALSVEGVKSVDNNLITPGSSEAVAIVKHAVLDGWITTKVKSKMIIDNVGYAIDVSVETVHGVVVLTGALENQDAIDHVQDIAESVRSVKSVDTTTLVVAAK